MFTTDSSVKCYDYEKMTDTSVRIRKKKHMTVTSHERQTSRNKKKLHSPKASAIIHKLVQKDQPTVHLYLPVAKQNRDYCQSNDVIL